MKRQAEPCPARDLRTRLTIPMTIGFAASLAACLALLPGPARAAADRLPLPPPVLDPHSTEICMNSRISYHGGWTSAGTDQMLGDVLHAASLAPRTGAFVTLYAATPQNLYVYDAGTHSLAVHRSGDWRSDATAAFEIGVAAENNFDAGAAMHLAQLESIALWTGTANQLASCPRASATTYANSHWNPPDPLDIVVSFGMRSVPGFTTTLVAVSSDASLTNPIMDGPLSLDAVLEDLAYDSTFSSQSLAPAECSQVLWSSYGCSNHRAAGSRGGLVCSSAVANYYLTRHIYWVDAAGVYRYHNRLPPGTDLNSRDHRLELIRSGDVRPDLRLETAELPDSPNYLILCATSNDAWPELEVGFAAAGALVEASSMQLQGYLTAGFSTTEQAGIREVTGIPSADLPLVVVSLGHSSDITDVSPSSRPAADSALSIEDSVLRDGAIEVRYTLTSEAAVDLSIYDCLGHAVRRFPEGNRERGSHTVRWDSRDEDGKLVPSGVYYCRVRAGLLSRTGQLIVIR